VTRHAVEDSGHQVLSLKGDLTDESVCRHIIEDTVKRFGRIDVLVNNAAFQCKTVEKFEELTAERLERTFRTNILAMFHLVRFALPHLKAGASIINVASIQAYQPSPGILDYASTKGAIVTFTKGLAQELIERGIRVNAVAPGPVWTPFIPQSGGPNFDQIRSAWDDWGPC
jgi:NAD(P)-dependent dehydrogenase (short-subunit alcohol dehydrogenase family)